MGVQLDDYFIEAMLSAFIHQEFDDGSLDIKDRFVSLLSEAVGVSLQLERGFLAGVLPDANYLEPESAQRKLEDMVRCYCDRHHVVQLYCDQISAINRSSF